MAVHCVNHPDTHMDLIRRISGDMRRDLAKDVTSLKELVKEAWRTCTVEYFQLIIKRLVNPTEPQEFTKSVLHDLVVFKTFSEELLANTFRNRQVWRAWHYIRELVVKYIPKIGDKLDSRIIALDNGLDDSVRFKLTTSLATPPRAAPERTKRPDSKITEGQWNGIPNNSLKKLLDEASREICGREREGALAL